MSAKPGASRFGKKVAGRWAVAVIVEPAPDFPDEYSIDDYAGDAKAIGAAIRQFASIWERETEKAVASLQTPIAEEEKRGR